MRHLSIAKTAMSLGSVFAFWHIVWVILIGVGWAREVLDFVLELHFIRASYQLAPYSAVTGVSLIALTFCVGALLGAIFALVWNWLTSTEALEPAHRTGESVAAQ